MNNKKDSKIFQESHAKCVKCQNFPVLNLLFEDENEVGGEISVLNFSLKKKEGISIYCTDGILLCILCQMILPTDENEDFAENFLEIFWQSHNDLRTSLFLAFCGHYRGAYQIMRSSYENIIIGFYLSSFKVGEEKSKLEEYNKFQSGDLFFTSNYIHEVREILREEGILTTEKDRKRLTKIYRELNLFVHPNPKGFSRICEHPKCISNVQVNLDSLIEWNKCFQEVVSIFIILYVNRFLGIEGLKGKEKVLDYIDYMTNEDSICDNYQTLIPKMVEILDILKEELM